MGAQQPFSLPSRILISFFMAFMPGFILAHQSKWACLASSQRNPVNPNLLAILLDVHHGLIGVPMAGAVLQFAGAGVGLRLGKRFVDDQTPGEVAARPLPQLKP
jgi:hypothetical protein